MPFQISFCAHSRVTVAPAQRRSGCRGSRLMRGNAHVVYSAACEQLAAPCRQGSGWVTARDGFPDLVALALGVGGKGVSDRIRRLGSACPCLQVVSPGSLGREASGGRLAMADPFSSKARVVAAAALSSSTGGPAVLIGLHLPEIF